MTRTTHQVLVDRTGQARLEWQRWDMFTNPLLGSVAYNEKIFVGQAVGSGGGRVLAEVRTVVT